MDGDRTARHLRAASGSGLLVFQREDGKVMRFFSPVGVAAFERIGFPHQPGLLLTFAVLTALAALATLIGVATRDRREARQTPTQARASLLQTIQAILWLIALVGVGVFASGAGDVAKVVYGWPSGWLLSASACAFVATLLTVATLAMLPVVWRGGRRVDSWVSLRKLAFTCTTLIFLSFAAAAGGVGLPGVLERLALPLGPSTFRVWTVQPSPNPWFVRHSRPCGGNDGSIGR
jgi:hypothetical protein